MSREQIVPEEQPVDGSPARNPSCCTKLQHYRKNAIATWRVTADMLFDKCRSKPYAVLVLVTEIFSWVFYMSVVPRSVFGRMGPYALLYGDCIERPDGMNAFSSRACSESPMFGPIWELLFSVLTLLVENSCYLMVNNPYRSKVWGILALFLISFQINYYTHCLVYLETGWIVNGDETVTFFGVFGSRENRGTKTAFSGLQCIVWYLFVIGLLISWVIACVLLIQLLARPKRSEYAEWCRFQAKRHAKKLLIGARSAATPIRYQGLCDHLQPTVGSEDLQACTVSVLREERRQAERRKAEAEAAARPAMSTLAKYVASANRLKRRMLVSRSGSAPAPAEEKSDVGEAQQRAANARAESGGAEKETDPSKQHQRPVLLWLAVLISVWCVVINTAAAVQCFTGFHTAAVPSGVEARGWASTGVQVAEQGVALVEQVETLWHQSQTLYSQLLRVQEQAIRLSDALAPVPGLLRPQEEGAADQVEGALRDLAQVTDLQAITLTPPSLAIGPLHDMQDYADNVTYWLNQTDEAARLGAKSAHDLKDLVDNASHLVEDLAYSLGLGSIIAGAVAVFAVMAILTAFMIQWPRVRRDVAVGRIRSSPTWKPEVFLPVLAPGFPGLLASSALFGTALVFISLLIGIQALWWFPHFFRYPGWHVFFVDLIVLTWNAVLSIVVKSCFLDKFLGRHRLTARGFVVAWASFTWYITAIIPFTLASGVLLAFTRFCMLIVIAAVHVVRLDVTLFPSSLVSLDAGYMAFMASILMDHRHRNPIWMHFLDDCADRMKEKICKREAHSDCGKAASEREQRHARAVYRWGLAMTLANNPQLTQWRHRCKSEDRGNCEEECNSISVAPGSAWATPSTQEQALQHSTIAVHHPPTSGSNDGAILPPMGSAHNSDEASLERGATK